jgi:plasmid stabilization system protein ParE
LKVLNVPDPRIPASLQHIFYEGSEILPKAKPFIDNLI